MSQSQESLIRDLPQDSRPREKALSQGIKSLSDAELMALIFATGIKGKSVITMCREMLDDHDGHLSMIARMSVGELCQQYKGIGPAKAIALLGALELGSRSAADARNVDNPKIVTSDDAYERLRPRFERLDHEEFWAILLSRSGHVLRYICMGMGAIATTTVDIRGLVRAALQCQATSVILSHNHPSGQLRPSAPDLTLTHRIVEAAKLFDISVLDHLIVTDGSYYSFRDQGNL